MNDAFEAYWSLQGARYSTGDHKERARHAYEAGARSAAPRDAGRAEWLDVLDEPQCLETRVQNYKERKEPKANHTWVMGYTGRTRRCSTCQRFERATAPSATPPTGSP